MPAEKEPGLLLFSVQIWQKWSERLVCQILEKFEQRSRWIAQAKEMVAAFPLPTYVGVRLRLVKIRNSEVISF